MFLKTTLAITAVMIASPLLVSAQDSESEAALAVTQQLLDAINTKDADLLRSVFFADAPTQSIIIQQGTPIRSVRTVDEMVSVLTTADVVFDERMFEPHVVVDGGMASIVAYYEFRVNGQLSHCGHDTFVMMQDRDSSWKISALTYTVRQIGQEACDELRANDGI